MAEKQALKEWNKYSNSRRQTATPLTKDLLPLLEMVKDATEPFLMFMKALLLYRLGRREEAIEADIRSIALYPWNWSAWTLLGNCVEDSEELSAVLQYLPLSRSHPLVQFFQIHTLNAFRSPTDHELQLCERLLTDDFFPVSPWVMSMRACALYHQHDFGEAEKQFQRILTLDPHRIDNIDIYSDILYVTDNRIKLSKLAHEFLEIDKDRPEVCCLVGNHYSLRAEHEKAIKYFKRAVQLDRTYLSAWTLMGHEFIELKNSNAAIEAYRRAADVNQKDYRAWYGLAQAYELLSMHQYALYYFQKATTLRPYDVRLWQGQAACYEELGRPREAIECLKRALIATGPHDTSIHLKLAQFHNDLEEYSEAAKYHASVISICSNDNMNIADYAKSALYIAQYHYLHGGGNLALAQKYLEQLSASNSEDVNTAQELLKQVMAAIQVKESQVKAKGTASVTAAGTDVEDVSMES